MEEALWMPAEYFRPADSLNRAELVKMVITVIDGLKGHTPPPTPTFDDVPPGAWFTNYIEAAATLGIITGYADAQGNLIGLFRTRRHSDPGGGHQNAGGSLWA